MENVESEHHASTISITQELNIAQNTFFEPAKAEIHQRDQSIPYEWKKPPGLNFRMQIAAKS